MSETHVTAPTHFVEVDGDRFVYRRWGKPSGIPMFFVSADLPRCVPRRAVPVPQALLTYAI
ncbi:hypothetical protein D3C75_1311490 [compost metagenome]